MIHQTRPPSSIAPWSSFEAYVPIVFVPPLTVVDRGQHGLCSPIHNKLRCTVYSDTSLSEPALSSSEIWATVACLLDRTTQTSLCSPHASVSLGIPWPCCRFTTAPSLGHFWQILTTADREHPTRAAVLVILTQSSSHHNLALVRLAQVLMLAYFPHF